jgi:CheY-like chemotaxis protein
MAPTEVKVLEPLGLSRRHKVILVDDDPAVLASLRRLLRREPYDVLSTAWPELALQWIEKGGVSLMVVDQRMPGMCGTELAERVRARSPRTIRVMLTAYPGNTTVQHGLARDIQWLISKPWNDDAFRLTLRQLLHHSEAEPPSPPEPSEAPPGSGEPRGGSRTPTLDLDSFLHAARRAGGAAARAVGWLLGFFGASRAAGWGSR